MTQILTFSTLYPNAAQPGHGPFVEYRLRKLVASGQVQATVVAPVPWFPFTSPVFGDYARFAAAPRTETRHAIPVFHPRYPVIPKFGMNLAPRLLASGARNTVKQVLHANPGISLIDAHYFYPDGVAAALLAQQFKLKLFITARGTDINLIPKFQYPRKQILWAAGQAEGIITVCHALKDSLLDLGVSNEKITVLRNGVDFEIFRPVPAQQAQAGSGIGAKTLLSVGLLIERKGHHLAIEALKRLPDNRLVIVGDGPEHNRLQALAKRLGVADRVRFAGRVAQHELPAYYSAADALVLASSREGMANVLLESIACGTPVVATPLWGTPEVVAEPAAGVLMRDRSVDALVDAVRHLYQNFPDSADTLAYAKNFSWDQTTAGQIALFNDDS